jgi:uncharacterized protein (DUF736 family)
LQQSYFRHFTEHSEDFIHSIGIQVVAKVLEVSAAWSKGRETSGKAYVSLSIAAPKYSPTKFYANLGCAVNPDDKNQNA